MKTLLPLTLAAFGLAASLAAGMGGAAAQTARTATIQPGKPARIAVETALKKDCSIGELGGIRVITAPKNGEVIVRSGTLKTPASFRCPNKETPVQQLVYMPKKNFTGTDEVSYETRTPEGQTQVFNIKINVGGKPASTGGGLQEL